jgi:hypothetical protein
MTDYIIPTPQEFFNQVIALDNKLAVHQACNTLLDELGKQYTVATISRKLSAYKKPFYSHQHTNAELNETIESKKGTNTQHIAGRLLTLSDEQKQALNTKRAETDNSRAGFNENGDIREVEKPPVDITAVVKKSLECLTSVDPYTIGAGIINLTGLRANEQNMQSRNYPAWDLIIDRDMVVVDEFVIGFKGISKKSNPDDAQAYHARVTLAPAQMIVDAQNRFRASKAVKSIPSDYEKYRSNFMDTFCRKYSDLFGETLSTVEAYDDEGNITNSNGTPHKGRAFYACALRSILKASKNFGDSAASKYIQLCLAHENPGITIKYLGRYDEKEFINPIDINIPTNIKGLGKMTTATIEKATKKPANKKPATKKTEVKQVAPKNTLDIDAFISGLSPENQVKFAELMSNESSLTNALLAMINSGSKTKSTENKSTVSDEIKTVITAIMDYNSEQVINTNCVVPSYGLINKIAKQIWHKELAPKTVEKVLSELNDDITSRLANKEITGLNVGTWNGKHHRKTLSTVIDSIITVLNRG